MRGGFADDPMSCIVAMKAMFGARQLMLFYALISNPKNYKHLFK
jgi:hypothetical protein